MPADKTIDTVLMILAIGALTLGLGSVALGWLVRQWDRFAHRDATEPEPARSDDIPLPNGAEPQMNGSANAAELYLNAAEVIALHRMIEHNKTAAKPSKSSTIQAGFGISRGGSQAYQRASLIYDALFGTPAPAVRYRERTPEQEAARAALGLKG